MTERRRMHGPLSDRFWARVRPIEAGCWEWGGTRMLRGYGRLAWRGRMFLAHRVSWMLANGPIPDGLVVMHTCDNPPCVRPDHLRVGTMADNQADMARKGRAASGDRNGSRLYPERQRHKGSRLSGERNGASKLTADQVREMRALGISVTEAAARYDISLAQASRVLSGRRWPHV